MSSTSPPIIWPLFFEICLTRYSCVTLWFRINLTPALVFFNNANTEVSSSKWSTEEIPLSTSESDVKLISSSSSSAKESSSLIFSGSESLSWLEPSLSSSSSLSKSSAASTRSSVSRSSITSHWSENRSKSNGKLEREKVEIDWLDRIDLARRWAILGVCFLKNWHSLVRWKEPST